MQFSEKFAELGLIQGQKLMLIDLDRCTRCDECVRACVDTHDDGRSRLFLDGPRFGKYLVPTTCRSCLDPVCMIGCPVASIHRGDNREIVIEDWCIGCRACAETAPTARSRCTTWAWSPKSRRGWRFLPAGARAAQGDWMKPGFNDSAWLTGESPFRWNRRLMEAMVPHLPGSGGTQEQKTLCFRFAFSLSRGQLRPDATFKIELNSLGSGVKVWLNGRELVLDDRVKRGRHEYSVPPPVKEKTERKKAADFLAAGRNVVAVQVTPTAKPGEVLMQLRLDEQKKPKKLPAEVEDSVADEVVEKLVTHRAVVCDLCSSLPGQSPACVRACPHDAALRVDARFNFPKN